MGRLKLTIIVVSAFIGILAVLGLTIGLAATIITSSLNDAWLLPGEQIVICKGKEFTVNPKRDGVVGYVFPNGTSGVPTVKHSATEVIKGTVNNKKQTDLTSFTVKQNDAISVEFEASDHVVLEVYMKRRLDELGSDTTTYVYKEGDRTFTEHKRGDYVVTTSKTRSRTKYCRFLYLSMSGSGHMIGSATLTEEVTYWEYFISINGTIGATYDINVTYIRNVYVSDDVVNCTAGEETIFNSEKQKGYCAALEMVSDKPYSASENPKNKLDLYCGVRFSVGDIVAMSIIGVIALGLIIVDWILFAVYFNRCNESGSKKRGIEM